MAKAVKSVCHSFPRKPGFSDGAGRFTTIRWFSIGLILFNSMLATCAEVLLKIGATHPPALILPAPITFVSTIFSFWVGLDIVTYVGSLFLWLVALPRLPLHLAYGLSSTVHLMVPFACWLVLLEEKITMRAWLASFLIAIGITLVALF
jgi:drug/metabolite transporter (DMT)-like permease